MVIKKSCISFPFSFRGIKSVCLGTRARHMRTEKSSVDGAEWCLLLLISLAWLQGPLVSLTLLSVCMDMCMSICVGVQLYVGACVHVWSLAVTLECHSSGTVCLGFWHRVSYWPKIHQLCGSQATSQRWDHKRTPHHHHHAWRFHLGSAN